MALDLTAEEKATGQANFDRVADGLTRRNFMKSLALAGGVVLPVSAAAYFGYKSETGPGGKGPVRVALIGAGDEGGVLTGEHDPKFIQIVAVCDIRPTSQKRIFEDERKKNPRSPRKGLKAHYGPGADKTIKVYDNHKKMLDEEKDIEAVIIALPLHLHAPVAIDCMNAGKHVLCEKLMAWNIKQCKEMIRTAEKNDVILSIGHQRHYSLLYAHALEMIKSGVLGDVRHIRALWHRNNALPKKKKEIDEKKVAIIEKEIPGTIKDSWDRTIPEEDRKALEGKLKDLGYKDMDELINWRLYKRTGGGLMAELGSHQLDACSIFLGKVRPLAVTGVGGKYFYNDRREIEDHVFCTFEFPGPKFDPEKYKKDKRNADLVIVTYSSISTNSFEPYGECVMGSRGTLVVEQEANAQLYSTAGRGTSVTVSASGGPALEASSSTGGQKAVVAGSNATPSRGYTEEMNHFAYCIRMWKEGRSKDDRPLPRCHGTVAMQDAIVALTSNLAMETQQRIEFFGHDDWFDASKDNTPEEDVKKMLKA
jgi:predicted dehydrogenase